MVLSEITFTLVQILGLFLGLYAAIVAMTILLDNRTPQSAFAWRILILGFPVIGLLIYIFFGRAYKRLEMRQSSRALTVYPHPMG